MRSAPNLTISTTISLSPTAFALLALGFGVLVPSTARAQECGVPLDMYEDAPLVADLHPRETLDALERGDVSGAASLARAALDIDKLARDLARSRVRAGAAFGEDDIRAALAVAMVRSGGAEGLRGTTSKPKQMQRNLEQARALLAAQARIHSGDPVVTTYLAEALVAVGKRDEARAILEDLAAADLIVSAEGWAALAAVTEGELSAQARTRCGAMARDASTCVPSPSVASASASRS